jgi:hypothetical protein
MMGIPGRNRCPSDGQLRETLDAPDTGEGWIASHLSACERCQSRQDVIAENARLAQAAVGTPVAASVGTENFEALARFRMRTKEYGRNDRISSGGSGMSQALRWRSPRLVSTVAAALAVVLVLSFSPVKTLADDFLNQFRVQKFAAITVPMDMIAPMQMMLAATMTDEDVERFKTELDTLGTFESTFGFDHDAMPAPMTLDEARGAYGSFAVPGRLPEGFESDPQAIVTEAGTASYTMDVARANEMIRAIGLPIFSLPDPDVYPTATFILNAPSAVGLVYTNAAGDMIVVGQMESPSLTIPEGIDMNALREDILRFPGLPTDFVSELRSIDDWENTLIIPIPEGATSRDVTINGQPGLLIESPEGSAVLWERNGVLHGVGGHVSGSVVLDVAGSMK